MDDKWIVRRVSRGWIDRCVGVWIDGECIDG